MRDNILIFKIPNAIMMDEEDRKNKEKELTDKTGQTCIIVSKDTDVLSL